MSTLQFKCTLLTDVVLNLKSASEGSRQTLDFIPGNNFLGIVAGKLYEAGTQKSLVLFHTGDVIFGDANPSMNGKRGIKAPAALFYPKLKSMKEECYVHHQIPDWGSYEMKKKQLKQCRDGFYCFDTDACLAKKVRIDKSYALKSAYDKKYRRSYDEKMYAYEALEKGSEFYFEVILSEKAEPYREDIKNALVGQKRIGRSRSAQYGLVSIEEFQYLESTSRKSGRVMDKEKKFVEIYADGRLIFLDEFGIPTFRPQLSDLGSFEGKIRWDLSQIRTFQYAPWNFKRQAFDTDRCGIEKGSVFIVEVDKDVFLPNSAYIGVYNNEGFGKVIYNPEFFMADENGKSVFQFIDEGKDEIAIEVVGESESDYTALYAYLNERKQNENLKGFIYKTVNEFVDKYQSIYWGDSFASQWGAIRSLAMRYDGSRLKNKLEFYLSHGVAQDKWLKKGRKKALDEFIKAVTLDEGSTKRDNVLREAIINLSAEMAKYCKK